MRENRVKRVMRDGGLAIGASSGSFMGPTIVEVIGQAGFAAVFIDMEHATLDLGDIRVMVIAAESVGLTQIVRTPGLDVGLIQRLLDFGVQGICAPHVRRAGEARAAVAAVRYPPLGARGMMRYGRAAAYGGVPLEEHLRDSNREVLLAVMIEDADALDDIDAIAATEGVDVVLAGPSDVSSSLGAAGRAEDPRLDAAIRHIAETVRRSASARFGLPLAHAAYPRDVEQLTALGVSYTNYGPGPETRLLRSYRQQIADSRRRAE